MVDVMGPVAAATAIDTPDTVDITDAQLCSVGAALSLVIGNSLTGIFGDLAAARKMNGGKAASAVD